MASQSPQSPPSPEAAAAVYLNPRTLRAWANNPRVDHDVDGIARSIQRLGFGAPILARPDGEVIAGHGRLAAALQLGLERVPVRIMAGLTDDEAHALALTDNAYTDASHNDLALYAEVIAGFSDDLLAALVLPEPPEVLERPEGERAVGPAWYDSCEGAGQSEILFSFGRVQAQIDRGLYDRFVEQVTTDRLVEWLGAALDR